MQSLEDKMGLQDKRLPEGACAKILPVAVAPPARNSVQVHARSRRPQPRLPLQTRGTIATRGRSYRRRRMMRELS